MAWASACGPRSGYVSEYVSPSVCWLASLSSGRRRMGRCRGACRRMGRRVGCRRGARRRIGWRRCRHMRRRGRWCVHRRMGRRRHGGICRGLDDHRAVNEAAENADAVGVNDVTIARIEAQRCAHRLLLYLKLDPHQVKARRYGRAEGVLAVADISRAVALSLYNSSSPLSTGMICSTPR